MKQQAKHNLENTFTSLEISMGSAAFSVDFLLGITLVGCSWTTFFKETTAFCLVSPRGGFTASCLPTKNLKKVHSSLYLNRSKISNLETNSLSTNTMYMSQAIAEITHFRKCLVISGNVWSFLNCLGIWRKFKT